MEFGVGIHGEPGIDRRKFTSLNDTVDAMFNTLIDNGHYQRVIRNWDRETVLGSMKIRKNSL